MIIEFPNRAERERDEILLSVMADLEAAGVRIVVENLLEQFIMPVTDGERRAFGLIAGIE